MIKVALTGNIGSGKSTVVKIFSVIGIPVFCADLEAKLLYKNPVIKKAVSDYFGNTVFNKQNEVDFKKLANSVFNDENALRKINEIIHPGVFKKYSAWLKQHNSYDYTIHEAAIIFENKLEHHFDMIINVSAPEKIRLERVVKRDGISPEQFYERTRYQLPNDNKNSKADYIVFNDGKQFLIPQIMDIHKAISTS